MLTGASYKDGNIAAECMHAAWGILAFLDQSRQKRGQTLRARSVLEIT